MYYIETAYRTPVTRLTMVLLHGCPGCLNATIFFPLFVLFRKGYSELEDLADKDYEAEWARMSADEIYVPKTIDEIFGRPNSPQHPRVPELSEEEANDIRDRFAAICPDSPFGQMWLATRALEKETAKQKENQDVASRTAAKRKKRA